MQVKEVINPLLLTDVQVDVVMKTLHKEMLLGLSRDAEKRKLTSLQMENTYVRSLLNGEGRSRKLFSTVFLSVRIAADMSHYGCANTVFKFLVLKPGTPRCGFEPGSAVIVVP